MFLLGWIIAGFFTYTLEVKNARNNIIHSAKLLLNTAISVRSFTSEELQPLFTNTIDQEFIPQSVPSYTAQKVFEHLSEDYQEYQYSERVLNPTNRKDLAEEWQVELIRRFTEKPDLKEIIEERLTKQGEAILYIAQPITVDQESCLVCHSTPEVAPPSMIKIYGDSNGFGWKINEIIGTRIVTVPVTAEKQQARGKVLAYLLLIASIFLVTYAIIGIIVKRWILSPLDTISRLTEEISLGKIEIIKSLDTTSYTSEFGKLTDSVNRLLISLNKALFENEQKAKKRE
jgi:HAMP domain-containing protein